VETDYVPPVYPKDYVRGEVTAEFFLFVIVLWEKSLEFADWWWTSVVSTGLSLIACVVLMAEFAHYANGPGIAYHVLLGWLALAMAIGGAGCLLALIKAAKSASHSARHATEYPRHTD
jgi:hypothetical protein